MTLDVASEVSVAVYDVLGREVAVLYEGSLAAGTHKLAFDGDALPTGVYVVRATGDGMHATQRLTVVR